MRRVVVALITVLAGCGGDASAPAISSAAKIAVVSGTAQSTQAGQSLHAPLVVLVTDANNQPVSNALVAFAIKSGGGKLSQTLDTTDASGNASVAWTVGTSAGPGQVEASAQFVGTPARFDVTIAPGPVALITRASAAIGATPGGFETADSIAVKVTDGFNNPIAGQGVTFSIAAGGGTVGVATRNTGADGIARTSWTVGKAGAQTLRATAGSLNVDITASAISCREMTLAVGEVQSLNPTDAACAVLNGSGSRYFVTIVNPANTPASIAGYTGRGAASEDAVHVAMLELNRQLLQRYPSDVRSGARRTNSVAMRAARPSVGDLIAMKVPDISANSCTSFTPVTARVVYVGSKGIVLEDTANSLRGQVDTLLTRVGHEFDDTIYPILVANFGDPLAMDAQLNNDGALYMLITDQVNKTPATGFVSNTDFLPASQCPSSNMAEVFYARGLTPPGNNPATLDLSFASTSRRLASVIIHESKHLTSAAVKRAQGFAGNRPVEDAWLEESSAEIAMELLSRVTYARSAKSNLDYATTIAKEARPASGVPLNMFHPFTYLYTYLAQPETRSLVGSVDANDFTFYGSGWAFLRWVIDTYATNESAFLTAMNRDITHFGVANIENLTGKPFSQLLGEFSLALALDDYPGFTPIDAKYSFPSWNVRSIFAGMNADFPNAFPLVAPLKLRSTAFGKFAVDVSGVRGGGFSVLELSGAQVGRQLLEFTGANGTAFPPALRINVVRLR